MGSEMKSEVNKESMSSMRLSSYISGGSAAYLEALYEAYLRDPKAVAKQWQECFANLPKSDGDSHPDAVHSEITEYFREHARHKGHAAPATASNIDVRHAHKQAAVMQLINAYRSHGHHRAKLDPLGLAQRHEVADLELGHHGLEHGDLDTQFDAGDFLGLNGERTLRDIYEALNQTYCHSIGVEYMHITNPHETQWLKQRMESNCAQPNFSPEVKKRILEKLTAAEGLEKYLGRRFVGQKRFSLEGGDSLIPLLDEVVQNAGEQGVKEVVIGMAHRGRLNVLINILGKSPEELFQEFEGKHANEAMSGDVKYHLGFSSDVNTPGGHLHLALSFNPSHLEIISPVVEGSVRARQQRRADQERNQVLPIIIHGDAAFAGQGVVMETFNMSQARGYRTGGSVHIVINNQIGFTTSNPLDARSTLYCTDVAKMVQAPILHVNGDDPEAVLFAASIALDFRMTFNKDVVIDLICYRRHGHNEADEPAGTQPIMYRQIKNHATTRKLYAEQLVSENVIAKAEADDMVNDCRETLDAGTQVVDTIAEDEIANPYAVNWAPYLDRNWQSAADTRYDLKKLKALATKLETTPEGFTLQKQVANEIKNRSKMTAGESPVHWGYAETLAYATLLVEGYAVRLSGQDSGRGTFSHRHAVLHEFDSGECYTPLKHLSDEQADITIIDSVLSEEAVLGFEYGYATAEPNALVIWEAQFGDFVNGAQVVIDQFISSGEQKWGRLCGLAMFLPHGYEGAGPEHSSARLERFLQLCAQHNMQVCVPSTPAQVFHMIRRQVIRPYRNPLIVMTPKSLLRHPLAVSSLEDMANGKFHLVIPEMDNIKAKQVKRIVLCSGKVYYDLLAKRREEKLKDVAIIRIEQLYPFPEERLRQELEKYPQVKQVIWCQEEPMNQGAWYCTQHHMRVSLLAGQALIYAGREYSASPAAGYMSLHQQQQQQLVADALGLKK